MANDQAAPTSPLQSRGGTLVRYSDVTTHSVGPAPNPNQKQGIAAETGPGGNADLPAAYSQLLEHLAAVEAWKAAGADGRVPDQQQRLEAAAGAIAAVLVFLGHDDAAQQQRIDRSLYDLMAALGDLAHGTGSPWLQAAPRTVKPKPRTSQAAVRRIAVLAMSELMEARRSKHDAARMVAAAISAGGLPVEPRKTEGQPAPVWATVAGWRERCDDLKQQLRHWRAYYARRCGSEGEPGERADALLRMLRDNAGLKI